MSFEDDEIRQLLMVALDGDASEEQRARLNELLRGSEQLRRTAAQFLRDDSILTEEIGTLEEALAFLRQSSEPSSQRLLADGATGAFAQPRRAAWTVPLPPRARRRQRPLWRTPAAGRRTM